MEFINITGILDRLFRHGMRFHLVRMG